MNLRVIAVAGVVIAGLAAGPSGAAAKSCKLIVDDKGDSAYNGAVPGDSSTDLVDADLASNATRVTAVIHLDKVVKTDPQAPFGQAWFVQFVPRGLSDADLLFLAAYSTPTGGDEFVAGYQAPHPQLPINTSYGAVAATGVIDEAKSEIRITANIKDFGDRAKLFARGNRLASLTAESRRIAGQRAVKSQTVGPTFVPLGGFTFVFDTAESSKTYTAGAPSCVAVGK